MTELFEKSIRVLELHRFLEDKITTSILSEDEIADAASPELADIRRHKRAASAKGRQILQKIISSPSYKSTLQEALITQRDGRFVVPVKAEHRGDLPGLVHDISASGATLFVEPMGVVQANNELKELEGKEKKEIERILFALSAKAAGFAEAILWSEACGKRQEQTDLADHLLSAAGGRSSRSATRRFVVPVKADHLPGLVHDISASGATLFVEPMGVVQTDLAEDHLLAQAQGKKGGAHHAARSLFVPSRATAATCPALPTFRLRRDALC